MTLEIEELELLPSRSIVAYAVRCAMRSLTLGPATYDLQFATHFAETGSFPQFDVDAELEKATTQAQRYLDQRPAPQNWPERHWYGIAKSCEMATHSAIYAAADNTRRSAESAHGAFEAMGNT